MTYFIEQSLTVRKDAHPARIYLDQDYRGKWFLFGDGVPEEVADGEYETKDEALSLAYRLLDEITNNKDLT